MTAAAHKKNLHASWFVASPLDIHFSAVFLTLHITAYAAVTTLSKPSLFVRGLGQLSFQIFNHIVDMSNKPFTTSVSRGCQQSRILSSPSFKDAWLAEEGRAFPPPTPLVGLSRRRGRAAGSLTFTGDVLRDATAAPHCSLDTRHIPRRVAKMSQSWRKRIFSRHFWEIFAAAAGDRSGSGKMLVCVTETGVSDSGHFTLGVRWSILDMPHRGNVPQLRSTPCFPLISHSHSTPPPQPLLLPCCRSWASSSSTLSLHWSPHLHDARTHISKGARLKNHCLNNLCSTDRPTDGAPDHCRRTRADAGGRALPDRARSLGEARV